MNGVRSDALGPYLIEGAALGCLIAAGAGFGQICYGPDIEFLPMTRGSFVAGQILSNGVWGVIIFSPLSALFTVGWALMRQNASKFPLVRWLAPFRWYYLPSAYVVGLILGLLLAVVQRPIYPPAF